MNSKAKKEIFNQLRVLYDGKAGLITGMDSGKTKAWEGKIAVIGLVTESIESVIESSSDLGERFLYYRYNPSKLTFEKIEKFQPNNSAKEEIKIDVKNFLELKKNELDKVVLDEADKNFIFSLSEFISLCRTKVDRSGYSREIVHVHKPEQPYRLVKALTNLFISLIIVNENKQRSKAILQRVSFDSIPSLKGKIIAEIGSKKIPFHTIQKKINGISESKIRRTIEDLVIINIVSEQETNVKNSKLYYLGEDFLKVLEAFR